MVLGFLFTYFSGFDPLIDPLQPGNTFYECFHPVSAGPLHFLGDVSVCVQCESCCVVPQIPLHGLDIVSSPEGGHGVAMAEIC